MREYRVRQAMGLDSSGLSQKHRMSPRTFYWKYGSIYPLYIIYTIIL